MYSFYFSPKSTTKRSAEAISAAWGRDVIERDLLKKPLTEQVTIPAEEMTLVTLPVYMGRIPAHCREMLRKLQGTGGPAVVAVVFGNRAYDNALLELCDLLEEQGFHVIAAGAFIGQHSIFPKVAYLRPDAEDLQALATFGAQSKLVAETFDPTQHSRIQVKGNPAYLEQAPHALAAPMAPTGNRNCIKCRDCVPRCPVNAISATDPKQTEETLCISCGACIYICPVDARGYWTEQYQQRANLFLGLCAEYQKPETFFAT